MLVRENINFERSENPFKNLNIGLIEKIKEWIEWVIKDAGGVIAEPHISDEFKIDAEYVDISLNIIPILPEYIKFGKINDDFFCSLKYLRGFPNYVGDRVKIWVNERNYTEGDIRRICEIKGDLIFINDI
jgi:hypothetical protein